MDGRDDDLARRIHAWGSELGLSKVGCAPTRMGPEGARLREWLERGFNAGMSWMARDPTARVDPETVLPGARAVVAVALNYYHPSPMPLDPQAPLFSRYAWGEDYHRIMGERLEALAGRIRACRPGTRTRVCCDTAPVLDKAWAVQAGLGWLGRNTCVIAPDLGSWFFLGEIFLDLELPADPPVPDRCGSCRRCLDVCPTKALVAPYLLDARRCISYLTIEHRGPFDAGGHVAGAGSEEGEGEPLDQARGIGEWLVGCDLCQEVCPWNRKAPESGEAAFRPRPGLADRPLADWLEIPDTVYRDRVRGTAASRIRAPEMRRNARAVWKNRSAGC